MPLFRRRSDSTSLSAVEDSSKLFVRPFIMDNATNSSLPPLYAIWFDELLGGEIPAETRATCHDCAMCDSKGEYQKPDSNLFNPQVKCCTYMPRLANYIVGMILLDEDPIMAAGRAAVESRLQTGLAVTPLGLEQPPKSRFIYTHIEPRAFGRAESLLCPYYINEQGGLCGIWKYRDGVCSTWFCKYERGAVGRDFWESAKLLLLAVEDDLSQWCALKLEMGEASLDLLLTTQAGSGQPRTLPVLKLEDMDDLVDSDQQRRIWGNWYGREQEFYRACSELVRPLSWSDVLNICGPKTQARARMVQQMYRRLTSSEIPARLRMGTFTVVEATPEFSRLYNPGIGMDVFRISSRVLHLLPYFNGRPVSESVRQVIDKEGLRFTDELLRRLVDFKILVAAEG